MLADSLLPEGLVYHVPRDTRLYAEAMGKLLEGCGTIWDATRLAGSRALSLQIPFDHRRMSNVCICAIPAHNMSCQPALKFRQTPQLDGI